MEREREELHAALEARRELGKAYEPDVVDAFLERVERRLEERTRKIARPRREEERGPHVALAIVSLGTGIPITAIAGGTGGIAGILIAWAGIVGVNVAYALSERRR